MRQAIDDYVNTIEKDDIAVFYFSGHGTTLNGLNYLIGQEAPPPRGMQPSEFARFGVPLDAVVAQIVAKRRRDHQHSIRNVRRAAEGSNAFA
jgi:Caspase domain